MFGQGFHRGAPFFAPFALTRFATTSARVAGAMTLSTLSLLATISAHAEGLRAGDYSPGLSDANATTIIHFPKDAPAWGINAGFVQNGAKSGVELEVTAPHFTSPWVPLLGIGMRTIDIEGHRISDPQDTVVASSAFVYLSAKLQNPVHSGVVIPYGILKLGALLTGDAAHSKSTAAGYFGFGGEFPFSELVQHIFNDSVFERSVSFFVETGVPVSSAQATKIEGAPFIFNGISSTIGFKYSL